MGKTRHKQYMVFQYFTIQQLPAFFATKPVDSCVRPEVCKILFLFHFSLHVNEKTITILMKAVELISSNKNWIVNQNSFS